jgi:5-formyltetrahydrofolate cyclo-ligase
MTSVPDRRVLRSRLRAARRAIPPAERRILSERIAGHASAWLPWGPAAAVAAYLPLREEVDTGPLLALARARGIALYLPRIEGTWRRRIAFVRETAEQRRNRFGIAEPIGRDVRGACWLSVVFVPLVGFDDRGARLGMGGGYYDRALAFRRRRGRAQRPSIVGLAFDCQRVARLPEASHDVRLDAIVTESGTHPSGAARR